MTEPKGYHIRGRSPNERREVRDVRSRPLLASMHEWLEASLAKLSKACQRWTNELYFEINAKSVNFWP